MSKCGSCLRRDGEGYCNLIDTYVDEGEEPCRHFTVKQGEITECYREDEAYDNEEDLPLAVDEGDIYVYIPDSET